jgi:uncharacterized protein YndB with AHSA1/START domain
VTTHGELRQDGDRRGVRFERRYDATPKEIWAALTEPEQLRGWLADALVFEQQVGGHVVIDFGDDGRVDGAVLVYDPPAVLEYEWRFTGEQESAVRFELHPDGDGTLLVLDHRRLQTDQAVGYGAGWHAHLDHLASMLDGESGLSWEATFHAVLASYRDQEASLM